MPVKIPWESIGPAASLLVIVLIVVFAFVLKFNKQNKTVINNSPALPKPTDTLNKKTLCFEHHGKISANTTKIGEMKDQFDTQRKENRQDHKDMFNKIDDMGTKIIQEISKNSSQ